jgi:hypothetical protein
MNKIISFIASNLNKIFFGIGICYMASMIGFLISAIGQVSPGCVMGWGEVAAFFLLTILPFVFGFGAGYDHTKIDKPTPSAMSIPATADTPTSILKSVLYALLTFLDNLWNVVFLGAIGFVAGISYGHKIIREEEFVWFLVTVIVVVSISGTFVELLFDKRKGQFPRRESLPGVPKA